jgi:predicted nucleic acid-binding protein
MNGLTDDRLVLDSCICIDFLNKKILSLPEADLFISVISRMEIRAKPGQTAEMEKEIHDFFHKLTIIPLIDAIEYMATAIRREGSPRLKLPDAIVAATAVILQAKLVTTDEKLRALVWPGFDAISPLP